ncbi:unnamed protein product [Rotaria socialis]|uniref:Uncharacterized protein n=1 Tax=Rotaria socialis TaxID=392032 RepID=A0A820T7J3_9BILA|nr:unnamed protein product [Rotaria socialis]
MPIRKQDAYQALELLEQYYNRLDGQQDKQLKLAIDRVIKVFKSRLFQALIDIQEFYESILLDENSDPAAKAAATLQFADECEKQPLFKRDLRNDPTTNNELTTLAPIVTDNPVIRTSNIKDDNRRQPTPTPFSQIIGASDLTKHQNKNDLNISNGVPQFNYDDHWEEIQVELQRLPGKGLGFSIAGGTDTPCINESPAVVITRITEGGIADIDHRLKQHDIILRVNDISFTHIEHQVGVDTLKAAETPVFIVVRRLAPRTIEEIVLEKPPNVHLGFSIAGGISHEHVKGDYGIFITHVIAGGIADKHGRLKVGDRLMSVVSTKNTYDLEFVEHKHAVECIRRACEEGSKITLVVGHPTTYSLQEELPSANTSIQNQLISKSETKIHRSTNNHEQEELSLERRVLLRRGPNGFGFNIISSEGGQGTFFSFVVVYYYFHMENDFILQGTFISFIQTEGAADKCGQLRKGDRILAVNNIDLRTANHEQVGTVLKNCGETADMHVIYKNEEFLQCQARNDDRRVKTTNEIIGGTISNLKTPARRQFFVQADFDYDPTRDPNLPGGPGIKFSAGDILHVVNAVDDSWWQAKRVTADKEEEIGIIPSKSRVEKKERARQKRVNFNQNSSQNNSMDNEKKKKKKIGLFNKGGDKKDAQSGEDTGNDSDTFEPVLSYQLVTQHTIDYPRPVIIFGPFKEIFNDQLINEHQDRFANCIPHTTRAKRDKEVDGREYHFVTNRKQMEEDIHSYLFIEAGEYGGNLYGTSITAVRDVAAASKQCILDVSGRAIRRLIRAGLYPISIYVKPRDTKWILENMGDEANEERAKEIYDKCNAIEQQFGHIFTTTVEGENLSDVYDHICDVINNENTVDVVWVPSDEKF